MRSPIRTSTTLFAASLFVAAPAMAYNNETHSYIAEVAVQIMQTNLSPARAGTDPAFASYVGLVRAAPQKLSVLRVGLPNSLPGNSSAVGGVLPNPIPGDDEPYPFSQDILSCNYFGDDNFAHLDQFRIEDFRYEPQQHANPCGLQPQTKNNIVLQKVLGFQAQTIDNYLNDTILWYKPTNAGALGFIKNLAEQGLELGLAIVLAPFVCLWDLFSGDSCDSNDVLDTARAIDPVRVVDGMIPGIGKVRSDQYTGLWHFIDVDSTGRFNNPRGILYYNAGPHESPGALDVTIAAGAALTGLSVNADAADGVSHYGGLDEHFRTTPDWQSVDIGGIEFSPLDNLAAYGWNAFLNGGRNSAAGLGWPLHAIGDASEPHHIVGTSAQGHRPFEDSVNNDRTLILDKNNAAQLERVLEASFDWYNAFVSSNLNIQDFITRIAGSTRAIVASFNDRVYQDGLSTQYLSEPESATLNYAGFPDEKTALLEQATSAALAFLVIASIDAVDPGPGDIKCPAGTSETIGFSPGDPGVNYQCDPGAPCPPGKVQDPTAKFCETPGQAQDAGVIFLAAPAAIRSDGGCATPCATDSDCASVPATPVCLSGCCQPPLH